MARSLDGLIHHLLNQIALYGDHGALPCDFIKHVNTYYIPPAEKANAPDGSSKALESATIAPNVDRVFLEQVWKWLISHSEIKLGVTVDQGRSSLSEVEAYNASLRKSLDLRVSVADDANADTVSHSLVTQVPGGEDAVPHGGEIIDIHHDSHETGTQVADLNGIGRQSEATQAPKDGVACPTTSKEPKEQSKSTHGVDVSKKNPSANKHSLPRREIRLYASENRMWLALTGHSPDPTKIKNLDFACLSIIAASGPRGIYQHELVQASGQDKRSIPLRTDRLRNDGYVVKRRVLVQIWKPRKVLLNTSHLVLKRFVDEGIDELNESEIIDDNVPSAVKRKRKYRKKSPSRPVSQATTSQVIEETEQTDDSLTNTRLVPQWTPNLCLSNQVLDIVEQSGQRGITMNGTREILFGEYVRRPAVEYIARLTECWQLSQPLHLRHLAIVRDTALKGKINVYVHYSWENFQKRVDQGVNFWQAVTTVPDGVVKPGNVASSLIAVPALDEHGFPSLLKDVFEGEQNDATLDECVSVFMKTEVVRFRFSHGDPILAKRQDGTYGLTYRDVPDVSRTGNAVSVRKKVRSPRTDMTTAPRVLQPRAIEPLEPSYNQDLQFILESPASKPPRRQRELGVRASGRPRKNPAATSAVDLENMREEDIQKLRRSLEMAEKYARTKVENEITYRVDDGGDPVQVTHLVLAEAEELRKKAGQEPFSKYSKELILHNHAGGPEPEPVHKETPKHGRGRYTRKKKIQSYLPSIAAHTLYVPKAQNLALLNTKKPGISEKPAGNGSTRIRRRPAHLQDNILDLELEEEIFGRPRKKRRRQSPPSRVLPYLPSIAAHLMPYVPMNPSNMGFSNIQAEQRKLGTPERGDASRTLSKRNTSPDDSVRAFSSTTAHTSKTSHVQPEPTIQSLSQHKLARPQDPQYVQSIEDHLRDPQEILATSEVSQTNMTGTIDPNSEGLYPGWIKFMLKYYQPELRKILRPNDGIYIGKTQTRRKRLGEPVSYRPRFWKLVIFKCARLRELPSFGLDAGPKGSALPSASRKQSSMGTANGVWRQAQSSTDPQDLRGSTEQNALSADLLSNRTQSHVISTKPAASVAQNGTISATPQNEARSAALPAAEAPSQEWRYDGSGHMASKSFTQPSETDHDMEVSPDYISPYVASSGLKRKQPEQLSPRPPPPNPSLRRNCGDTTLQEALSGFSANSSRLVCPPSVPGICETSSQRGALAIDQTHIEPSTEGSTHTNKWQPHSNAALDGAPVNEKALPTTAGHTNEAVLDSHTNPFHTPPSSEVRISDACGAMPLEETSQTLGIESPDTSFEPTSVHEKSNAPTEIQETMQLAPSSRMEDDLTTSPPAPSPVPEEIREGHSTQAVMPQGANISPAHITRDGEDLNTNIDVVNVTSPLSKDHSIMYPTNQSTEMPRTPIHQMGNLSSVSPQTLRPNDQPKRRNIGRTTYGKLQNSGGSAAFTRRNIVMDLIQKCDGIFPGTGAMTRPFAVEWAKLGLGGTPEQKTIDNAVSTLCEEGKLQKINFKFMLKEGKIVERIMLALASIEVTDPRVKEVQVNMIATWPRFFVPDAVVPPEGLPNDSESRVGKDGETQTQKIQTSSQLAMRERLAALKEREQAYLIDPSEIEEYTKEQDDEEPSGQALLHENSYVNQAPNIFRMPEIPKPPDPRRTTSVRRPRGVSRVGPKRSVLSQRTSKKISAEPLPAAPIDHSSNSPADNLLWLPQDYAFSAFNYEEERPTLVEPAMDNDTHRPYKPYGSLLPFYNQQPSNNQDAKVWVDQLMQVAAEEVFAEEAHTDEGHTEEVHTEEIHPDEIHSEEANTEELNPEEVYSEGVHPEGVLQSNFPEVCEENTRSSPLDTESRPGSIGKRAPLDPIPISRLHKRALLVGFMDPIHCFHQTTGTFSVNFAGLLPPRLINNSVGTCIKPYSHGPRIFHSEFPKPRGPRNLLQRRSKDADDTIFEKAVDDALNWELETSGLEDLHFEGLPFVIHTLPHALETAEVAEAQMQKAKQYIVKSNGKGSSRIIRPTRPQTGNSVFNRGNRVISTAAAEALKRIERQPLKRRRLISLIKPISEEAGPAKVMFDANGRLAKLPRIRGPRNARSLGDRDEKRLLSAVVVVRTLTGGLEKHTDWALVAKAFGDSHTQMTLNGKWNYVRKKYTMAMEQLESDFENAFARAYQDGSVPPLDFDNLLSYNWKWLTDWTMALSSSHRAFGLQPNLPADRAQLDGAYALRKTSSIDINAYYEINDSPVTIARRTTLINRAAHVHPVNQPGESPLASKETGQLAIAKSWVRANTLTPEDKYNPEAARDRLATFPEAIIEKALKELLSDRVLSQENRGRLIPGRNYDVSKQFFQRLKKNITSTQLHRAQAYKLQLDQVFNQDGSVPQVPTAESGEVLAVINLQAQKQIQLVPIDPPLNKWGFTDDGYKTRHMDKDRLNFKVQIRPSPTYVVGNPLEPLPGPPSRHLADPMAKIPLWYDIHDSLLPILWDMALAAVLAVLVIRPGIGAKEIESAMCPAMETWEIQQILDWCVDAKAASRTGDRFKTTEWWWLAIPGNNEDGENRSEPPDSDDEDDDDLQIQEKEKQGETDETDESREDDEDDMDLD